MRALLAIAAATLSCLPAPGQDDPQPEVIADGVWLLRSTDVGRLGSNVAWVDLGPWLVVIDTAFPRGAERALRHIDATAPGKPIRWAVMTHYHPDHSFGSGAFAARGATVVAHDNAAADFASRGMARWPQRATSDPAAAAHPAVAPAVTFAHTLTLAAGDRRLELHWFGHAHTSGDLFAFLPDRGVLFTGDACVNGPFNYLGDADVGSWITVLRRAEQLGAARVVPGHGEAAGGDLLATQRTYFEQLRTALVATLDAGLDLERTRAALDVPVWRSWTGLDQLDPRHVEHVRDELVRGPGRDLASVAGDAIAVAPAADGAPLVLRYLTPPLSGERRATLQALAPNVELVEVDGDDGALAAAPTVHGMDARFCSAEVLRAAGRLRWVQAMSAGVERYLAVAELRQADAIVLTNMQGAFGTAIADHAIAMLLAGLRRLPLAFEQQRAATWQPAGFAACDELDGKTMLVVGLGGIGRQVAQRAHAFGMRVVATDPHTTPVPPFVDRLAPPAALDDLLPDVDVVCLCLPLTERTRHLFDARRLARMRRGARLVNIARGAIVDTDALVDALRDGHLGGAALDVTDPEPLPDDHPLWSMPQVVITPHVAGRSPLSEQRRFDVLAENMRRFARGLPLLNVVDKRAGY